MTLTHKIKPILQKLALFVGSGAMFVAVSEFWFYQVDEEVGSIAIILFYALAAYVFISCAIYYRLHSFFSIFIAAALFGFITESVFVPVLFTAMPFTIVWTSLAWHALISVMVFWYGYRHILALGSPFVKIAYLSLMGAALGLWNSFMWNAIIDDDSGVMTYSWIEPNVFLTQFLFGFALFLGGHLLYSYGVHSVISVSRNELLTLFTLITAMFVLGFGFAMFPFSIALPVLVYLCHLAFIKQYDETATSSLFTYPLASIPWYSHIYSICIPIAAYIAYYIAYIYKLEFEANALLIITAGPLSVYWFIKGFIQCARAGN